MTVITDRYKSKWKQHNRTSSHRLLKIIKDYKPQENKMLDSQEKSGHDESGTGGVCHISEVKRKIKIQWRYDFTRWDSNNTHKNVTKLEDRNEGYGLTANLYKTTVIKINYKEDRIHNDEVVEVWIWWETQGIRWVDKISNQKCSK